MFAILHASQKARSKMGNGFLEFKIDFSGRYFEWIVALQAYLNEISSLVGNKGSLFPHIVAYQPAIHKCGI